MTDAVNADVLQDLSDSWRASLAARTEPPSPEPEPDDTAADLMPEGQEPEGDTEPSPSTPRVTRSRTKPQK